MTYVVTENCINCKHTTCIEVCPTECFHDGPNFLVINPDYCVDCDLCRAECPVGAIYPDLEVPPEQIHFIELNDELSKDWPNITEQKDAPIDAKIWDGIPNKLPLLMR